MARKETDIQIGGRFWSTTVDGKIVDASQVEGLDEALNLNLKNGLTESKNYVDDKAIEIKSYIDTEVSKVADNLVYVDDNDIDALWA